MNKMFLTQEKLFMFLGLKLVQKEKDK